MQLAMGGAERIEADPVGSMIPEWFLDKKLDQDERYAWKTGDGARIVGETDKAVLFGNKGDFGDVTLWVPKSVLIDAADAKEAAANSTARSFLNGLYTDYLKATAIDNGVKIGNASSWDVLAKKTDKNGVRYMSRDQFAKSDTSKVSIVPKPKAKKGSDGKPKGRRVTTAFGGDCAGVHNQTDAGAIRHCRASS